MSLLPGRHPTTGLSSRSQTLGSPGLRPSYPESPPTIPLYTSFWKRIQEELARKVVLSGRLEIGAGVVGCDCAEKSGMIAGCAVLIAPDLSLSYGVVVVTRTEVPYIPGFLAFREVPVLLKALEILGDLTPSSRNLPLFVDGHGIAHPRRLGIASHLGVKLDRPAVGVAKSPLLKAPFPPRKEKGCQVIWEDQGEPIGWVLVTRSGAKPIYLSPGHRVGLEDLINPVLALTCEYRLPEPLRFADQLSRRALLGLSLPKGVEVVKE